MNRWFSLYLDIVRLAAAGFVVYAHSNVRFLLPTKLPLAEFAHSAVTVFFVLSGYVVAFVADQRESTPVKYAASRASRILSVSILAVLLTPLIDSVGRSASPEVYANPIPSDYAFLRILSGLTFLGEIWSLAITMFSNVPYWSLNYEVWYYVIFGVYCFVTPTRKWWVIGLLCLFLGPKIVLMLPCWLAGVVAYRWRNAEKIPISLALLLWILTFLSFLAYHYFDLMRAFSDGVVHKQWGEWFYVEMNFSRYFAADWLLALIIAFNFVATRKLATCLPELKAGTLGWVGFIGSLTYALYIIHVPFIYMWGSVFQSLAPGIEKYLLVLALTLASVGAIAFAGEWLRPRMRKSFETAFGNPTVVKWSSRWANRSA